MVADSPADTRSAHIMLVDDDPGLLRLLSIRLELQGYEVTAVENAAKALQSLRGREPDVVVSDMRMDGMDGIALLETLQRDYPGLPVILLTAHGTIPDAVKATQQGALAFLTKPINRTELSEALESALRLSRPRSSEGEWPAELATRSPRLRALLREAYRAAQAATPVLIVAEQGAGAAQLAAGLHRLGPHADAAFTTVDCRSSEGLEEQLFGAADVGDGVLNAEGVVFLDDVAHLGDDLQKRLLRLLTDTAGTGNAQIVAATHADLAAARDAGSFREDLYYRLAAVQLVLPPLRERRDDIPQLVNHYLRQLVAGEGETQAKVVSPEAMELLVGSDWPGNLNQLAATVEKSATRCTGSVIGAALVESVLDQKPGTLPSLTEARDEFIRSYLVQLLQRTEGNVSRAARLAQRNRTDFYKLLARHQVDPQAFK